MAVITLPGNIVPNKVEPFLRDFGTVLTPFLGGEEIRYNRLGLRMAGRFTIPPKLYGTQGRVLVSRLIQAKQGRLRMAWPQPGISVGSEGAPKVKVAVSGGTSLQIKGLPASKVLSEGWFLSVAVASEGGRRYLHPLAADATANGSGDVTVTLAIPIRTALAVNDVIEIVAPMIEGHVLPGEELRWEIAVDKFLDVSFTVAEAK